MFLGAIAAVLADAPKQHALVLAQDLRLALRLIRRERCSQPWRLAPSRSALPVDRRLQRREIVGRRAAIPRGRARNDGLGDQSAPGLRSRRHLVSAPARLARAQPADRSVCGLCVPARGRDRHRRPRAAPRRQSHTEFFGVVQTEPVAGRLFAATEEQAAVVVLGYGLWQRKFGGTLARSVKSCDWIRSRTIIGVLPQSFQFPARSGRVGSIATERRGTEAAAPSG